MAHAHKPDFVFRRNLVFFSSSSSVGPVADATDVLQPRRLIVLILSPSPACLDVPTFAARYLHFHNDARDPSSESTGNFAWRYDFHVKSGIFYMPQICDMGLKALLPLRRKACWGLFRPEKSKRLRLGLNPRTWVLKGSTLAARDVSLIRHSLLYVPQVKAKMSYSEVKWCQIRH